MKDKTKKAPEKITDIRVLNYSPKINPLVERKPIKTKSGFVATKMTHDITDAETGEHFEHALIHQIKSIDEAHFVKVFAEGVKQAYELNRTEMRVFQKILSVYEKEKMPGGFADSVSLSWFDGGLNGETVNMSDVTFNRGLKALLNKGFLSPKTPNVYWVNPSLFFKGDRVAFITEYRKATEQEILEAKGQTRIKDV